MSPTADIPVSQDYIGAGNDRQYTRPPLKARFAWFDFFRPDYDWLAHLYPSGQPDSDYLRNRIARLTFDLRTGEAQIGKLYVPGQPGYPTGLRASQTVRLVRTVRSSRADRAGARASSSAMSPGLSLSCRPCRARPRVTMA